MPAVRARVQERRPRTPDLRRLQVAAVLVQHVADGAMTDTIQAPRLVVARRMPDGSVTYGAPGQQHVDLMDRSELETVDLSAPDLGFALPGGDFMSRREAAEWVKLNEPERYKLLLGFAKEALESFSYGIADARRADMAARWGDFRTRALLTNDG